MSARRDSVAFALLRNVLLVFLGLFFFLPALWLVEASFSSAPGWALSLPTFTMKHFKIALEAANIDSLYNSLLIACLSTLIATIAAVFAGYALSRRRVIMKDGIMVAILFLTGVPVGVLIVPVYNTFANMNWLSIIPASIFISVTALPFEIWIMKNFIDAIPSELEEAAMIERASIWYIMRRVIVPLSLPGIASAAILGFINAWGRFLIPLVLITDPTQQPAPITIYGFIGAAHVRYGEIAAFSVLYSLPPIILYWLMTRAFGGGFGFAGAIKG